MTVTARLISLTVLTAFIVMLGITFFQVIAPFLLPLFLAGVLTVLCQPLYRYFLRKIGGYRRVAAGLTTIAILLIVLVPLIFGVLIGSVQLYTLGQETLASPEWQDRLHSLRQDLALDRLVEKLDPYVAGKPDPEQVQAQIQAKLQGLLTFLAQRSLGVAATAVGFLISLLTFVLALYYFLADGPALIEATENLIPLHLDYQRQLLSRFETVIRAVVVGTFLAAITQGFATAIALYLVNFQHFFMFLILGTLAAMIPLTGTWLIWVPCALWLLYEGSWGQAIFLVFFGSVIIGLMDNLVRAYVLNTDAKLHPLLAFVSVLGGLQVMGLWGVFIGPVVASCLHALVQIFNAELHELSKARLALQHRQSGETRVPSRESQAEREEESPEAKAESPELSS